MQFLNPYHNDLFQYRTSDFNHPTHSTIYTDINNKELVFKLGSLRNCLPKTRRNYNKVHLVKNMMTKNDTTMDYDDKILCPPIRQLIVSYMSNIQTLVRVQLDVWNKSVSKLKSWKSQLLHRFEHQSKRLYKINIIMLLFKSLYCQS